MKLFNGSTQDVSQFTVKSILSVCALKTSSFHITLGALNAGPGLASKLSISHIKIYTKMYFFQVYVSYPNFQKIQGQKEVTNRGWCRMKKNLRLVNETLEWNTAMNYSNVFEVRHRFPFLICIKSRKHHVQDFCPRRLELYRLQDSRQSYCKLINVENRN